MLVPVSHSASDAFTEGASVGFHFGQLAEIHDRHAIGPHKLSDAQAKQVVEACKSKLHELSMRLQTVLTNRPVKEISDYTKGFGEGISLYIEGDAAKLSGSRVPIGATSAWKVYYLMLQNQEKVASFHSLPEFYEWLCSQLGDQQAGDFERVKSICKRIGLSFRKSGRPRKEK